MPNPFRQLLERLIRSSDSPETKPGPAPDLVPDDAPDDALVPASEPATTSEQDDFAIPVVTAPSSDDILKSPAAFAPTEPALPMENPHAKPQSVDIKQTERTRFHDAPANDSDVFERDIHSPSWPIKNKASRDGKIHLDIDICEPRSRKRGRIMEEPIARFDPNAPTLASLIRGGPVGYPVPDPVEPRCNAKAADSRQAPGRDQDDSLAARIKQLLDSFEQNEHEQDRLRTFARLEATLQRLQTSQDNLSQLAERLDQLETAHLLRGRL